MKCLYRHLFLEDTSTKRQGSLKNLHPPKLLQEYFPGVVSNDAQIWYVACQNSCDKTERVFFFNLKHCQVMVIGRGDVTDNVWVFALFEMKCFITNQFETALIIFLRLNTT